MSRKSFASRPGLRKWLNPCTYLDGWFTLLERSRAALHHLLDYGFPAKSGSSYQRRPSYLPQVEGLEMRTLMSITVQFIHSTDSVNYNATLLDVTVRLSSLPTATVTVDY